MHDLVKVITGAATAADEGHCMCKLYGASHWQVGVCIHSAWSPCSCCALRLTATHPKTHILPFKCAERADVKAPYMCGPVRQIRERYSLWSGCVPLGRFCSNSLHSKGSGLRQTQLTACPPWPTHVCRFAAAVGCRKKGR